MDQQSSTKRLKRQINDASNDYHPDAGQLSVFGLLTHEIENAINCFPPEIINVIVSEYIQPPSLFFAYNGRHDHTYHHGLIMEVTPQPKFTPIQWNNGKHMEIINQAFYNEIKEWQPRRFEIESTTIRLCQILPLTIRWSGKDDEFRSSRKRLQLSIIPPKQGLNYEWMEQEYNRDNQFGGVLRPVKKFNLERILHHMAFSDCIFMTKQISIYFVCDSTFALGFTNSVGGHGYRRKLWWEGVAQNNKSDNPMITVNSTGEDSSRLKGFESMQKIWKELKSKGCSLDPSCDCTSCENSLDHSSCKDDECPWTELV